MIRLFVLYILFFVNSLGFSPQRNDGLNSRIIGGDIADITAYPYQVSVMYALHHVCGGSVISQEWVVTAASCVSEPSGYAVRAGTDTLEAGGTVHTVVEIIKHPDYVIYDYDVAVLRVAEPFVYGSTIMAVRLSITEPFPGTIAVVTGWGRNSSEGELSPQLLEVMLPVYDHQQCNDIYHNSGGITINMICAGVDEGGKDFCIGDYGAPLVIAGQLVGVASWTVGCGAPGLPGVYASIPHLHEFVTNATGIF